VLNNDQLTGPDADRPVTESALTRQRFDLLTRLEQAVLDWRAAGRSGADVPDVGRVDQGGPAAAVALSELESYLDREAVSDYRVIAVPILWDVVDG
jgi:hypothetical protein